MTLDDSLRHPLAWPVGQPRTLAQARRRARFGTQSRYGATTIASQISALGEELGRMRVADWLVSSNLRMRQDGLPYSQQSAPDDPGIAVYFRLKGRAHVLACDRWDRAEHNLRAIVLHIQALRGQERWGVGTMEQAFAGYAALPPAQPRHHWSTVLHLPHKIDAETAQRAKEAHRRLSKLHHPDRGGNPETFKEVQAAWEECCADLERAGITVP